MDQRSVYVSHLGVVKTGGGKMTHSADSHMAGGHFM